MSNKNPKAKQPNADRTERLSKSRETTQDFRTAESSAARNTSGGLCVLLGVLALAALILYVFMTATYSQNGTLTLPEAFPVIAVAVTGGYALLCGLILFLSHRSELKRFRKKQAEAATDSSAVRLFKEKINLPYVVTDADGKIIVANRAFEDAVAGKYGSVGEDIREICKTALDSIIRTTASESETDQKISEVHTAAVRAYPSALHKTTTTDTCLALLKEIDAVALSMGVPADNDPDSPLLRVHEIASNALCEAEKRSELWHLCLGTLESILSSDTQNGRDREKLSYIYELARDTYRLALEKENEMLRENALRDFSEALEKITLTAESDPAAGQLASACRLRLEMFRGKNLLPHLRTLLLNMRQQLAQALPDPTVVTDDKDTVALQAILKRVDEGLANLRTPRETNAGDREFCISLLSSIVSTADSLGANSVSRYLHTIKGIADAALCALLPERADEYVSLVTRELMLATSEKRDTSATDEEAYRIASELKEAVRNGNREDEERFIASFRDAVRRIAEESRFGMDASISETDRIRTIVEQEVSGTLSALELRTSGASALSKLIKYGEETLTFRDLGKNDQKLLTSAVSKLGALKSELLAISATDPSDTVTVSRKISKTLTDLLSKFDEKADYTHQNNISEDERSAPARMKIFYSEIEKTAATTFPHSAEQLAGTFFDRASLALMGYRLYHSVILKAEEEFGIPASPSAIPAGTLAEISDKEYSDRLWNDSSILLLLHIGVLRVHAAQHPLGTVTELTRAAELTFEKLTVRRVLAEALVSVPMNSVRENHKEGAPDGELYRLASAYFREAATHRSRLLLSTCRVLMGRALALLDAAERFSFDGEAEKAAFAELRTELERSRTLLISQTGATNPDEPLTLAAEIFRACASKLEAFEKKEYLAGVYHASLVYLAEFFGEMNNRLLRREFFRTYRDTADEIASSLYRAEYTLTAILRIRTISESVLEASSERAISFSGLSLKDCCSSDLRTIAGLSGIDIIGELSTLADAHAEEALTAKPLWELRKQTLSRIAKRLDFSEDCSRFHDTVLVPRRNEIGRLRKLADDNGLRSYAAGADMRTPEEESAVKAQILAELSVLPHEEDPELLPRDSVAYRFGVSLRRLLATENAPFGDFLSAFPPFYDLLNRICTETLSFRRNKKRILLLRRALKEEESVSFIPKTGAPLSRQSVYELFSEYLDATLRTVRPVRESNPPMNDIFHIVSNTKESIEDDSSLYFRLFASSSLSRIAKTIAKDFSAEHYAKLLFPLADYIRHSAKSINIREHCPTQESIVRICTLAFREADALFRLGEIANDSLKLLSRYSAESVPAASDSSRIYNTVSEIRQKIETCCQSVPRKGSTRALFELLEEKSKLLRANHPHLDKEKYTGEAFHAMTDFLRTVSEVASPYLLLIDNKDTVALRAEVSRIRRNVREVSDATSTVGSRATAASALAAIGQYATTFDDEAQVSEIAAAASNELSDIPDGFAASERIYAVATAALAEISAKSGKDEIRAYASKAHLDLHERRTMYHYLVTAPIEQLSAKFHDPTASEIYPAAEQLYRKIEQSPACFRAELTAGILRDSVESIRSMTEPDAFSRIRSVCDVMRRSVDEFEADLRALPLGHGEYFIPPAVRTKQKQLHIHLDQLFALAKTASAESREDPDKAKLAEKIMLIVYRGIANFTEIAAGTEIGSMNRIPDTCRAILDETVSALRTLSLSEEYLSDIRRSTETLLPLLPLPVLFDESVSAEDHEKAFEKLIDRTEKAVDHILKSVLRFREESPMENAVGSLALYRCETVARSLSAFLSEFRIRQRLLAADSLCSAVADLLAQRAGRKGKPEENSVIAVYDRKGRPSGQNNMALRQKKKRSESFVPVKQNEESTYRLHGLSVSPASVTSGECVTLGNARYIARSYPHRSGGRDYYLVTFSSAEETLSLKQSCEDENTVVALITLDNLEELAQYVRIDYREAEKDVEKALRKWAGEIHGIFHEYERDKYILFFSQKEMASLVNNNFSDILNTLENIKLGDSSVSVTISMGISALGNTLTIKEQNASLALDMALKRGGAQIVIFRDAENHEDRYEFFRGNRVKGLQKENRVGARVVANYLCELIRKSGDVLVMGHAYPDFDSIGSCVGIAALARYYKKDVHIVVNRHTQNFIDCTPDLLALPEYQNMFIDGTTGMELKGTDTLLVLCDVSNTNIMEYVDIARTSFNTVIIDHHFKTTDSDDLKTLLTYIDPSASSASELVSEILEEALPKDELRKEEANVLLSGIMVDTKNFTRSVGARTFAAALYLRQMGANAEISSTYFYEQSGDYKAEVIFRKNLDFHKSHREIAITYCNETDIEENPEVASCDLRVAASKAADKLLTVRGIHASFALYPYVGGGKEGIAVSGRSDGSVNVQQILEAFHGGGHFDSAGATLPGKTLDSVIDELSRVIDDYFREEEDKAAGDILN